jgi:hypothetical protein
MAQPARASQRWQARVKKKPLPVAASEAGVVCFQLPYY